MTSTSFSCDTERLIPEIEGKWTGSGGAPSAPCARLCASTLVRFHCNNKYRETPRCRRSGTVSNTVMWRW